MAWEPLIDVDMPLGCEPCPLCGGFCMEAEGVENNWHGRGLVIRISALCDGALDCEKDDWRTAGFAPEAEAVAAWNEKVRTYLGDKS